MNFDCFDDILDTSSLLLLEKLKLPAAISRGGQQASYNWATCKHLPTRKRVMGGFFPHYSGGPNQSLKSAQNKRIAVLRYAGILGISGLLRYLGLINVKLDRVIAELGSRPSACGSKPVCEDGSTLLVDSGSKSVMRLDMDPVVVDLGLGSDLAMELDWVLDSDPDVAFSPKSSFLVPDLVCAGTRGSVGKVETEDASTISPVVDLAT
jgi:hypothetical protein